MTVHMAQYQLNKDETAYEFETLVDSKNSPYAYNRQPARSKKIVIDFDKVAEAAAWSKELRSSLIGGE